MGNKRPATYGAQPPHWIGKMLWKLTAISTQGAFQIPIQQFVEGTFVNASWGIDTSCNFQTLIIQDASIIIIIIEMCFKMM